MSILLYSSSASNVYNGQLFSSYPEKNGDPAAILGPTLIVDSKVSIRANVFIGVAIEPPFPQRFAGNAMVHLMCFCYTRP